MSQFRGYKCDKCGAVVDKEDVTSRIVRLDGPVVQGEYEEDLCRDCVVVPDDVKMRPLRRRASKNSEPEDSGGQPLAPAVGE